jgi:hypothetical protein
MTAAQAAVINKIDKTPANQAALNNLATQLAAQPPRPTPPKVTGLVGILLTGVDSSACYGVALFDTVPNATAAKPAFDTFWRTTANLQGAVHQPMVASTVDPSARMVWIPTPIPITGRALALVDELRDHVQSLVKRTEDRENVPEAAEKH